MKKGLNAVFVLTLVIFPVLLSGCGGYSYQSGLKDIDKIKAEYTWQGDSNVLYVPTEYLEPYASDLNSLKARVADKGDSKDIQAVIATIDFQANHALARRELISAGNASVGGINCTNKDKAEQFYSHSQLASQHTRNAIDALGKLLTDYRSFLNTDVQKNYFMQKINLEQNFESIDTNVGLMKEVLAKCK